MLAGLCSTSVGTRPRRIQLNHSCALWSSEAKETYLLLIGKDIKTSKFWAKLVEASFRNSPATSRNICLKLWLAIVVNRWQRSFVWICREVRVRWFKILGHYLFAVPLGSRRGKASIEAAPRFGCFSWTWSACKLPPQGNNYGNNFCTVFVWTWYECVWVYTNIFFDVDLKWRYDIWKIISEYRKCCWLPWIRSSKELKVAAAGPGPFYPGSAPRLSPVINLHKASDLEESKHKDGENGEISRLQNASKRYHPIIRYPNRCRWHWMTDAPTRFLLNRRHEKSWSALAATLRPNVESRSWVPIRITKKQVYLLDNIESLLSS